jgi:hypothetical protein
LLTKILGPTDTLHDLMDGHPAKEAYEANTKEGNTIVIHSHRGYTFLYSEWGLNCR